MISSLPGSASRTHVESLGKPRHSTCVLEALPSDSTRFSKPCLVNLISMDTHLVFSISGMLELTNIYLEQAAVFNCVRTPVNVTAREVRSTLDDLNLSSNFAEDFLINTNVNIQN